jgi:hypothetical protein
MIHFVGVYSSNCETKFKIILISRADGRKKLTISWDNSILPSYCALKANKYVSVCWPR